jgi:hypothetical protein
MSEVRQRTVRLHAVRKGDEFHHDHKWWIVKQHNVPPGAKFSGLDKDGNKREDIVPSFSLERSCAIWISRGRFSTVVFGPKIQVVKIIRRNHGK